MPVHNRKPSRVYGQEIRLGQSARLPTKSARRPSTTTTIWPVNRRNPCGGERLLDRIQQYLGEGKTVRLGSSRHKHNAELDDRDLKSSHEGSNGLALRTTDSVLQLPFEREAWRVTNTTLDSHHQVKNERPRGWNYPTCAGTTQGQVQAEMMSAFQTTSTLGR